MSRTGSHQLRSGLYVSGRPETQLKDRTPTMSSRAAPYTGGDVKNSGELGKMYGVSTTGDHPHHHLTPPSLKPSSRNSSGSARSGPNSGPIPKRVVSSSSSGPMTPIQPTGLITSGPLRSGPLDPVRTRELSSVPSTKTVYGSAVSSLSGGVKLGFKLSKIGSWVFCVVVLMGLIVGFFLFVALKKVFPLVGIVGILVLLILLGFWNFGYKDRGFLGFLRGYPDAELRGAVDGQYVKVTGVVTCGSIPLESSFQREPRCVYVSSELYEYRGCGGKAANATHRFFSWGCRHSEKYVADFYISDFQSGLRALVKAGYGAKVAPLVKPSTVVDITKDNKELSPNFLRWLADRGLSSDDRIMRLKEGYIKEGSTVSVMGVVRRQDNILMIVPPPDPISTGRQWTRGLLPVCVDGLVILCDDNQTAEVIPV
ncbi:hypothetical protein LIER_26691 [Lithospermum erythrorhizon]|uniref:Ubiquitin-specific protease family C19-related protein n=1 Tax=Lithospermum erythrorhizon TaxID=34254 RepID=A0AAV3RF49_LITER